MPAELFNIRALRPQVDEADAFSAFRTGFSSRLFQVRCGGLRSVASVYVPFQLYEVEILNRGRSHTRRFAIDAVNGSLDLYEFAEQPEEGALVTVETRNSLPPRLNPLEVVPLLKTKVERILFQTGFFRLRGFQIRVRPLPGHIYIPYWLGFYGDGERAHFRVLDAVRRRMEGSRAAALFHDWMTG